MMEETLGTDYQGIALVITSLAALTALLIPFATKHFENARIDKRQKIIRLGELISVILASANTQKYNYIHNSSVAEKLRSTELTPAEAQEQMKPRIDELLVALLEIRVWAHTNGIDASAFVESVDHFLQIGSAEKLSFDLEKGGSDDMIKRRQRSNLQSLSNYHKAIKDSESQLVTEAGNLHKKT